MNSRPIATPALSRRRDRVVIGPGAETRLTRPASPTVVPLVSPSGRVRATPPPAGTRYWRLTVLDPTCRFRIHQTTGGTSLESAVQRLRDLDRQLVTHSPAGAHATMGVELLDYFLDDTRPKNLGHPDRPARWSTSYADQNRYLINRYLRPHLARVALAAWAPGHAYAVLNGCPTNYLVDKVRRTLSSVISLGIANSFLRPDQRELHRVAVPLRPELRPERHPRTRQPDAIMLLRPDEVPSTEQVARLAAAAPPGLAPVLWAGIVNALAYGGFRIGELFALDVESVLDDLPTGLVAVRHQVIEPRSAPKRLTAPKNGFARLTAICNTTPIGFPLREWIDHRAHVAAAERTAGRNRAGVLVATPRGTWWTRSNFRSRCFNPAATAADWEQLTWHGPVRRRVAGRWVTVQTERHDWRHPVHALRHHYACAARDVWGWTGAELCLNGGWADEAFVISRYYGSTAETYRHAVEKQSGVARSVTP